MVTNIKVNTWKGYAMDLGSMYTATDAFTKDNGRRIRSMELENLHFQMEHTIKATSMNPSRQDSESRHLKVRSQCQTTCGRIRRITWWMREIKKIF